MFVGCGSSITAFHVSLQDSVIVVLCCHQQEKTRWSKDPLKHSCEAYLNVRKELSILLSLQHQHIVPLIGVSTHPLSLVLSLATQVSAASARTRSASS